MPARVLRASSGGAVSDSESESESGDAPRLRLSEAHSLRAHENKMNASTAVPRPQPPPPSSLTAPPPGLDLAATSTRPPLLGLLCSRRGGGGGGSGGGGGGSDGDGGGGSDGGGGGGGPGGGAPRAAAHRVGHRRVSTLKLLPSRFLSRLYGAVNKLPLPTPVRPLVYGAWCWWFRVKLEEVPRPLSSYAHLTEFFTRRMREGCRPVHPSAPLVSPVDGCVVAVGAVGDTLAHVKHVSYHVTDLLGQAVPALAEGSALFSAVLYLSPGDYHRFHAATECVFTSRTHIAGQLLPVNPLVAALLPSLFVTNERVALLGSWAHGFFSYTAVGATNVGSIKLSFDAELATNVASHDWAAGFAPLDVLALGRHGPHGKPGTTHRRVYAPPIELVRGDDVGLFELGSTVVLVFEAPALYQWGVSPGDPVCMGMPLGGLPAEGESVAQQQLASAAALSEALVASFGYSESSARSVDDTAADGGASPTVAATARGGDEGTAATAAEAAAAAGDEEAEVHWGRSGCSDADSELEGSPPAAAQVAAPVAATVQQQQQQQQQQQWRHQRWCEAPPAPPPHDCSTASSFASAVGGLEGPPLPPPSPTDASQAAALDLLVHVHAAALAGVMVPLAARAATRSAAAAAATAAAAAPSAAPAGAAAAATDDAAATPDLDERVDDFSSCASAGSDESGAAPAAAGRRLESEAQ